MKKYLKIYGNDAINKV